MEGIDLKNFCLVVLGDHKDIDKELELISESSINYLEGNGVFIATFKSFLFAKDLEMMLSDSSYHFILCEIIPSLFSVNLGELTSKLFNKKENEKIFNIQDSIVEEMSSKIEEEMDLDQLLDLISQKGYNSLTQKQKEKLNFLSTKQ
jgi:hypothetical protein